MANRVSVMRKVKGQWVATDASVKSVRSHSVGVDPHREEGGKRKGRNMKRPASEERSGTVLRAALERVREIDPNAELTTVAQGRRVKMIRYFDPSVRKGA